jgi:hypothetical protein
MSKAMTTREFASELADREAIRDCLYRFSRGCDRIDPELILSSVWPEVRDDHGVYYQARSAPDLVDKILNIVTKLEFAKHILANILIRIDGDQAYVETYHIGLSRGTGDDGARYEQRSSGRYIDRMERRNDEWRIAERVFVMDWVARFPPTDGGEGAHKPDDRSYALLPF